MKKIRILSAAGPRDENWPDFIECIAMIERSKLKYSHTLGKVHTLELLGLSEALTIELELRRPAIKASGINTEGGNHRPRTVASRRAG